MKKLITMLVAGIIIFALSACGGGESPKPSPTPRLEVSPTQILSVEDATNLVGYTLVQDGDVVNSDGAKAVAYRSDVRGGKDIVKVALWQQTSSVSKDSIKSMFVDKKAKRPKAIDSATIKNCYIAYPSVTFYTNGYMVQITAGSGGDEAQKSLLEKMASKTKQNLESLVPETKNDEGNVAPAASVATTNPQ